jgi:hypothetical protein
VITAAQEVSLVVGAYVPFCFFAETGALLFWDLVVVLAPEGGRAEVVASAFARVVSAGIQGAASNELGRVVFAYVEAATIRAASTWIRSVCHAVGRQYPWDKESIILEKRKEVGRLRC